MINAQVTEPSKDRFTRECEERSFTTSDGAPLFYRHWAPVGP